MITQDEKLHKEIDLIQNCIGRMANNSFLIKGWLLSIIALVVALLAEDIKIDLIALALIFPIICFWFLDAFFLQTEKKYRHLYQWVLKNRLKSDKQKDKFLYDLNPTRFDDKVDSIFRVMFSITLRVFYGIPFMGVIVLFIVEHWLK